MKSRARWRLYTIALGCLLVVMYATVMLANFRRLYLVDLPITVVAYTGLIGYAFRRRIGSRTFWKLVCVAFVAWDILFNFVLSWTSAHEAGVSTVVFWMVVVLVPEYVALWRYGFRSEDIWSDGS